MSTRAGVPPPEEVAEAMHLTRYLLSEHPWAVDRRHVVLAQRAQLVLEPGVRRIVRVQGGESPLYYVIDGMTVTTTRHLPDWDVAIEVQGDEGNPVEGSLLRRLQTLHASFAEIGADRMFPVELDWLTRLYDTEPMAVDVADNEPLYPVMGLSADALRETLDSAESARRWAARSLIELQGLFHAFRVTGAGIVPMVATLAFLEYAPVADQLLRVGTELLAAAFDRPGGDSARILPIADVGFYVTSYGSYDPVSVQWAWTVAAALRDRGTNTLDRTRDVMAFEEHLLHLYDAMLWFLAAAETYKFLDRLYTSVDAVHPALPLVRDERVLCEERRVVIHTALGGPAAVMPALKNYTNFRPLWDLLVDLRERPPDQAELQVRDLVLRLILPRFLGNICLGWVKLGSPATYDHGVRMIQRQIARLEDTLSDRMRWAIEPGYSDVAHDCLVVGADQAGRREDFERFKREREEAADRRRVAISALTQARQ